MSNGKWVTPFHAIMTALALGWFVVHFGVMHARSVQIETYQEARSMRFAVSNFTLDTPHVPRPSVTFSWACNLQAWVPLLLVATPVLLNFFPWIGCCQRSTTVKRTTANPVSTPGMTQFNFYTRTSYWTQLLFLFVSVAVAAMAIQTDDGSGTFIPTDHVQVPRHLDIIFLLWATLSLGFAFIHFPRQTSDMTQNLGQTPSVEKEDEVQQNGQSGLQAFGNLVRPEPNSSYAAWNRTVEILSLFLVILPSIAVLLYTGYCYAVDDPASDNQRTLFDLPEVGVVYIGLQIAFVLVAGILALCVDVNERLANVHPYLEDPTSTSGGFAGRWPWWAWAQGTGVVTSHLVFLAAAATDRPLRGFHWGLVAVFGLLVSGSIGFWASWLTSIGYYNSGGLPLDDNGEILRNTKASRGGYGSVGDQAVPSMAAEEEFGVGYNRATVDRVTGILSRRFDHRYATTRPLGASGSGDRSVGEALLDSGRDGKQRFRVLLVQLMALFLVVIFVVYAVHIGADIRHLERVRVADAKLAADPEPGVSNCRFLPETRCSCDHHDDRHDPEFSASCRRPELQWPDPAALHCEFCRDANAPNHAQLAFYTRRAAKLYRGLYVLTLECIDRTDCPPGGLVWQRTATHYQYSGAALPHHLCKATPTDPTIGAITPATCSQMDPLHPTLFRDVCVQDTTTPMSLSVGPLNITNKAWLTDSAWFPFVGTEGYVDVRKNDPSFLYHANRELVLQNAVDFQGMTSRVLLFVAVVVSALWLLVYLCMRCDRICNASK